MIFNALKTYGVNLADGPQQQIPLHHRETANSNHAGAFQPALGKIGVTFCQGFIEIGKSLMHL